MRVLSRRAYRAARRRCRRGRRGSRVPSAEAAIECFRQMALSLFYAVGVFLSEVLYPRR
jgi:hypothetical protein